MILFLDNYDSFTYNLYQYIGELYPDIQVVRNDEITLEEIEAIHPDALLISPGPGYPKDAGISIPAIQKFAGKMPILGICLGHQAIAEAFGGRVIKAEHLMHGKASNIAIDTKSVLFHDMPQVISCGRYHSLIVEGSSLPSCLRITARDENGQIMAIEHTQFPVYGLQFHPESILTDDGREILIRFLNLLPGVSLPTKTQTSQQPKKALLPYAEKVLNGDNLTETEAAAAMDLIMSNAATDIQIAEFLTALRIKGETIEEITGFAKGMRAKAKTVPNCRDAIDIVGTGGDCSNSFNISTTSSFVIAAAGAKVAKHGNRSVSSKSGAADVLERLGVKIQTTPEQAANCIHEIGISFLFAQSYHGSMKYVAKTRKEMGTRTVFNILGPLANPAETDYILLGVYDDHLLTVMAKVLCALGIRHAMVMHGEDGFDEVSISAPTKIAEIRDGGIFEYSITPEQFGLPMAEKSEITGGTPEENALITQGILSGTIRDAKRNIVLLNAGCALYVAEKVNSIGEGIALAAETIDSGAALTKLEELKAFTNALE
ncbi:MAG: bifunctional anthranilate synthase component II/anthranilate phosphoribosyltransferase [Oscillospiraceae bacterium]|nr:bifunctional anthranilate synthase component II/anthranilate phosphoribosyltransferase [Oscillospiraceae bacterium]